MKGLARWSWAIEPFLALLPDSGSGRGRRGKRSLRRSFRSRARGRRGSPSGAGCAAVAASKEQIVWQRTLCGGKQLVMIDDPLGSDDRARWKAKVDGT